MFLRPGITTVAALAAVLSVTMSTQADQPPDTDHAFDAAVGDYAVRFDPRRAWTLSRIDFRGQTLGKPNGNYGFTYHRGDSKYIGGSHDESGDVEQVLNAQLFVDGRAQAIPNGGVVKGQRIEFVTVSRLDGIEATQRTIVTSTGIERLLDLDVKQRTQLGVAFAFMHCWTEDTTAWIARERSGEERLLEGELDSEDRESLGEIFWAAVYDPSRQMAVLTVFPPDNLPGEGAKHWIWDIAPYHKQYYQAFNKRSVEPGEQFAFRMFIKVIEAPEDHWKAAVRKVAPEYEGGTHIQPDPPAKADAPQPNTNSNDSTTTDKPTSPVHTKILDDHPDIDLSNPPAWLDDPVAMEALDPDTVLEPWHPVQVDGDTVTVWGRSHELGDYALPRQITALDQPLLAGPIQLDARTTDGQTLKPSSDVRQVEQYRGRVTYRQDSEADDVRLHVQAGYEYDGFVRYDVQVDTDQPDAQLAQLHLVIPLTPEQARFMQHASPWTLGMSQQVTGYCGGVPAGKGEVYRYGFSPFLWIGGYDRGLSFSAESDEHWWPAKSDRAIRIERTGDRVTLRIAFIDEPTPINDGLDYTFALMATPVKPLPEGWRSWRFTTQNPQTRRGENHDELGDHIIYWNDKWRIIHQYPIPRDMEAFRDDIEQLRNQGADRFYAYLNPWLMGVPQKTHIPGEDFVFTPPEWKAFIDDWAIRPGLRHYLYQRVSPASGYGDFALAAVKDWIVKGHINGVYLDESFPYADTDARKGQGYTDSAGNRQPTWAMFALRDFYKRLAWLFQEYADGPPALLAHTSSTYAVPYLGFADIALTGEQWYHTIRHWDQPGMPSYIRLVELDDWHAEMRGVQFGMVPLTFTVIKGPHLKQFPGIEKDAGIQRDFLTLALLHDVLVWANFGNNKPILAAQRAKDRFGMDDPNLNVHPYWQPNSAVANGAQSEGGDLKISYYTKPDRSLLVLGNLGDDPSKVTIDVAAFLEATPSPTMTATIADSGEVVPINAGKITVNIPARDFRLVQVQR